MDPRETRKAIPVARAFANRFKQFDKIYISAQGGSVFGKYLVNVLNMVGGPGMPEIIFVPNYDEDSFVRIKEDIERDPEKIGLISISKSGTTQEVNLNGLGLEDVLEKALLAKGKTLDDIKEHILLVTDPQEGDERQRAKEGGYLTLIHQEHGGRFTTWSTVGLLPYFLKGGDAKELEKALDQWDGDLKVLEGISDELNDKKWQDVFNLEKDNYSDQERIKAMSEFLQSIEPLLRIDQGFFINIFKCHEPGGPQILEGYGNCFDIQWEYRAVRYSQ